jgi:hypothetical protein
MIENAHRNGFLKGLADNLVDNGITILQYANDTILLIQDDLSGARNLKLLLYIFEVMSGLKINFEKSEIMLVLDEPDKLQDNVDLFNYQKGKWPIKYLGTPVCARRLSVAELQFIEDKMKKNMGGWMGSTMSIGGRLIKIGACLSNIVVYQISMRLLHKTNIENISRPIRAFFWAGAADKKKYHFVKWRWICKPRSKGGLGVKDLHKVNISLM